MYKSLKSLALTGAMGAALLAAPLTANAADKYEFDKAHTQILFFVDHLGYSMSQGEFLDYDGHFMFDEESPENSSVEVTIQTASIDMDDEKWDEHLKNEDFFNVSEYPTMSFESTGINVTGEDTAELMGDLTMLGQTKPVTLNVTHNKSGPFPMNPDIYKSGFSAEGTIKRSEWGLNYGLPGVGDDVKIMIEVEGQRTEEDAAATTDSE